MSGPYPFDDLLMTKFEVPLVGHRIVQRRRLTDALSAGAISRLSLLVAPTGYGKTTLLVEWLSGMRMPDWRTIWLTVDSYDNEPFRIWSYIATAMKKVYPRLRFDPQNAFHDQIGKAPLEFLTPLFNAVAQIPYRIVLILDDYQWITDRRVHDEIRYLLDHQPKNLHLLISSRVTPPFPLSRLRAQRQLTELTARDLSFTLSEAENFFSSAMQVQIDHDQAASMLVATEGWIAGLQLVTLSLEGRPDKKAFIASLPEENYQIFEYLTEEVLDRQAPELRDFLLKTSILSELSAPLCDALLERKDSHEMLNRIQQANLFIVSLDERRSWYSYHRLFSDTLQKYLKITSPDIIPDLHRRACAWLYENGYPDKAVSHALAFGDVEQAAKIIDACALQAVITFDLVQLVQWLTRFSDDLISKRPQLGIYYALANFLLERFDMVEPKLQALEQILENVRGKTLHADDEKLIRWEIAAIRACLDYWQANSPDSVSNFLNLMQNAPKRDMYFCGLMLHNLAEVYSVQGDLSASENAYVRGCQFAIDYGLIREYCYSKSELTYVRKIQGQLRDAALDYQDLIEYSLRFGISEDVIAFAKAGLAEIAVEQNQMDQAGELVRWVTEHFDRIETSPRNWIRREWLFVRLARYYLAQQDIRSSMMFFDKVMDGLRANPNVVHYLSSQIIDMQVKIWSETGALNSAGFNIVDQLAFFDPSAKAKPAVQIALSRYYLAQKEPVRAVNVLDEMIPELERQGMKERLLESLALKALACNALGSLPQALDALHQALSTAAAQGYQRVFIDEGDAMRTLLERYAKQPPSSYATRPEVGELVGSLISELNRKVLSIAAAEAPPTANIIPPLPEPFSHRELEILHLIAGEKSTKEIASALMISVNTTKVHVKNIYRKTGTHSRTALVQRAIELGILQKPGAAAQKAKR